VEDFNSQWSQLLDLIDENPHLTREGENSHLTRARELNPELALAFNCLVSHVHHKMTSALLNCKEEIK
jgi:hypothetical protein